MDEWVPYARSPPPGPRSAFHAAAWTERLHPALT